MRIETKVQWTQSTDENVIINVRYKYQCECGFEVVNFLFVKLKACELKWAAYDDVLNESCNSHSSYCNYAETKILLQMPKILGFLYCQNTHTNECILVEINI